MPNPLPKALAEKLRDNPELLGRVLALCEPEAPAKPATCPEDLMDVVWPLLAGRVTEALVCVALDRRRKVIGATILTTGSDCFTVVCPRQVLRWALMQGKAGASAIALAHNHPSGDETPSVPDRDVTHRIAAAARVLDIHLIDHLIVTDNRARYTSLAEQGEVG